MRTQQSVDSLDESGEEVQNSKGEPLTPLSPEMKTPKDIDVEY